MELLVYSQDRTYSSSLSDSKKEENEDEDTSLKFRSIVHCMNNHATIQELMLHLKSYYKVSFYSER